MLPVTSFGAAAPGGDAGASYPAYSSVLLRASFFCRPGQRSATGRKSVLFKQRVYVVLFVIERWM
ncbi:hypothetical protein DJ035_21655 [Salmonella enterica]|nr:hypothetical protein EL006_14570 [Salmonella enterica subsp. enterica serovar Stanleyville]EAM3050269.1 hypothetical protein [Salmonella enterica]EAA7188380.1 hypothetical protein [Salmonella enterica subsp. enterica serovar Stanleyville]EAP0104157.1 hypothetical protein [Salmonella enterica]EBR7954202.1 hypothetical protein [Salmonella enterica subsp. enterica serovar Stanleyville]